MSDLKFRSKFYPYGPWLAVVLFVMVLFGANMSVFQTPVFSWFDFVAGYGVLPLFAVPYLWHKLRNHTRLVPLKDCDFEFE